MNESWIVNKLFSTSKVGQWMKVEHAMKNKLGMKGAQWIKVEEWFNVEPSSNHKVGEKVEQWIKNE